MNRMEGYLTSLEDELMDFRDVEYKNFTKKEEEIIDLFYFKYYEISLCYHVWRQLQRISLMR